MKKLIPLLGIVALFFSCDKVTNPIVPKPVVVGQDYVKNSNLAVMNFKKVLIEDYTGQTCPNCPTGARVIEDNLIPVYGNTLISLSVHQGATFAQPVGTYTNDFRTEAGDVWGSNQGFGIAFWPCGLINRKNYNNKGILVPNQSWPSIVATAVNDPFILQLFLKTEYDTTSRALNVSVKGTFKQAFPGAVKIVAVFQQDSIVGKQKDGGQDLEEYEFQHMMRGDISGTWGVDFKTAAAANDTASYERLGFPLPSVIKSVAVNDHKVSVIVFAYDVTTRNVLQVEKVKIRP